MDLFDVKKCYLLVVLVAGLACGTLAWQAARNEFTGQAVYHQPKPDSLHGTTIPVLVTRHGAPDRFRQVTNWHWAISLFCGGVAGLALTLYRKLDDCV